MCKNEFHKYYTQVTVKDLIKSLSIIENNELPIQIPCITTDGELMLGELNVIEISKDAVYLK